MKRFAKPQHPALSLARRDFLTEQQNKILHKSAIVHWVLDTQERRAPDDSDDHPMPTVLREALTELVAEIHQAARDISEIVDGKPPIGAPWAAKGGA